MHRATLAMTLLVGCWSSKPHDTAPEPEDEVCDDGADNDLDGLTDCEDSDCMDLCLEDCTDGADNDADGDEDCYDDECTGEAACAEFVSYELSTDMDEVYMISGGLVQYYVGYPAVLLLYAEVDLQAIPDDPALDPFHCVGWAYGYPANLYYYHGYAGTTYVSGSSGGSTSTFQVVWDEWGGTLDWDDPCPLTTIPTFHLKLSHNRSPILRQARWGGWYGQYDGYLYYESYADTEYPMYNYALTYWGGLNQLYPVSWRDVMPN